MTYARLFYHFKKDLFPWAYWNHMVCHHPTYIRELPLNPNFRSAASGSAPRVPFVLAMPLPPRIHLHRMLIYTD